MDDQVYNIAEAKMHLSHLVERVERGERITIARNNRPVAVVSPAHPSPDEALANLREALELYFEDAPALAKVPVVVHVDVNIPASA